MQDTPERGQLLAAVRGFLKGDIAPAVEDPALRFRVLVAANILGVVERELALDQVHWAAECARLAALDPHLEADAAQVADPAARRALVAASWQRLLADTSEVRAEHGDEVLRAAVQATLAEKLAVVNPRFDLSPEIE